MTQPKDAGWLKSQLVSLMEDVIAAEQTDHTAAAKYAELLFKMLPQESNDSKVLDQDLAARVRAGIREKIGAPASRKKTESPGEDPEAGASPNPS